MNSLPATNSTLRALHRQRIARSARRAPLALALALVLGLLDACGQKGPLVLPGHAKDTPWPLPPSAAGTPAAPVTAPTPVAVPAPADTQPAGAGNGAAPAPPLNGP